MAYVLVNYSEGGVAYTPDIYSEAGVAYVLVIYSEGGVAYALVIESEGGLAYALCLCIFCITLNQTVIQIQSQIVNRMSNSFKLHCIESVAALHMYIFFTVKIVDHIQYKHTPMVTKSVFTSCRNCSKYKLLTFNKR